MNEKDTTLFEIKVAGLADLLNFITVLKDVNTNIKNLKTASVLIDAEQRRQHAATQAEQDRHDSEMLSKAERNRLNRLARAKIETDAIIGEAKRASIEQKTQDDSALANERVNTEKFRLEKLKRTQANASFNTSLLDTNRILGALGISFGLFQVSEFAQRIFSAQSKIEGFQLSIKNLIGETSGGKLFQDLKDFAVRTPFSFEGAVDQVQQLVGAMKAVGASNVTIAREVIPTLESLGNSAAALGGGDRLGRLVYAFTQVQSAGRLMGTEVRQIAETGFPLMAVLSEQLGIKVGDLQKKIKDGQIGFSDFKKAILSAGQQGGVFAGQMDIMAGLVSGKIEKLKDTFFLASAKIGDYLAGTAKKTLDFANKFINALFGTEDAIGRTITIVKALTIAILTLTKGQAAWALAQTAINVLLRASTIIQGTYALTIGSMTTATNVLSIAQLRAAVTARAFWVALAANPIGLVVTAISGLVIGYQLLKKGVDENQKKIDESTIGLMKEQSAFNSLGKQVLATNLTLEQRKDALIKLKAEHPLLLKGVKDLDEAEIILNKNGIKSNVTHATRSAALEQLKLQYPQQMKGINDVADAERRLSPVMKATNADFAIRAKLLENEIRMEINNKTITDSLRERIDLTNDLKNAQGKQLVATSGGAFVDVSGGTRAGLQQQLNERNALILKAQKDNEQLQINAAEFTKKLNYQLAKALEPPDNTKPPKGGGLGKAIAEQLKYVTSDTIANQKIAAQYILDNAKDLSDKLIGIEQKKNAELADVNAKYLFDIKQKGAKKLNLSSELADNVKDIESKAEIAKNKAIIDSRNKLNKDLEKAEEELTKTQKEAAKIRAEFQIAESHDMKITLLIDQRDALLASAKTEKQKLSIIKEYSEKIYKENVDYVNKKKALGVKQYNDEVAALKDRQKILQIEVEDRINAFALAHKGEAKLIEQFTNQELTQLKIDNTIIENEILKSENKVIDINTDANKELMTLDKEHRKEIATNQKDANKAKEEQDKASLKRRRELATDFYKAMKTLVIGELNSIIDSLEKIDTEGAKAQLARYKGIRDGATQIFTVTKDLFKDFKFEIGDSKLGLGDAFKDLIKGGETTGADLIGGLAKGVGTAIKANPFSAIVAAYKIFDAIMTAVEQNRLAKVKAVQNAIIKENNKQIAELNAQYEKLKKELEDTFDRDILNINAALDKGTIEENLRYGKQLANLATSVDKKQALENKFISESLKIRELYGEGLNSTDEKIRLKTEAIVDGLINNLIVKWNNGLIEEINVQEKRSAINKDANQKLLDLGTEFANKLQEQIDAINAKRNKDLADETLTEEQRFTINQEADKAIVALKVQNGIDLKDAQDKINDNRNKDLADTLSYGEKLAEINKTYDDLILEAKKNTQELTEEALAAHIATIEGLRASDIAGLAASGLGLANASQANADRLQAIQDAKDAKAYARQLAYDSAKLEAEKAYKRQLYGLEKANFEANKLIEIAKLKVELAQATRGVFAKGALVRALLEAIGEISNLSYPELGFHKGTDNTSMEKKNKKIVDSKGGFVAVLHPKEQIYSEAQMEKLQKYNGGIRPTREQVIQGFGLSRMNPITAPMFSPFVNQKLTSNVNLEQEIKKLRKDMTKFADVVANSPKVINSFDKGGFSTFVANKNKKIEIRQNKYAHRI